MTFARLSRAEVLHGRFAWMVLVMMIAFGLLKGRWL